MKAKAGYKDMTEEEKAAWDADAKKKFAGFNKKKGEYEGKDMDQRKKAAYFDMTDNEKKVFD